MDRLSLRCCVITHRRHTLTQNGGGVEAWWVIPAPECGSIFSLFMVKQSIHCDWSEITDKARTVITQHHAGVWLVAPNIISPTFFLDFTAVQPIIGFTIKDSRLFLLFFASGRSIAAFHLGEAKPDYEVFSIPLLASDQWKLRQQLEGFLQFGGSLECWEVTVTFDVTAPPSGRTRERSLCGLLLLSLYMRPIPAILPPFL